MKRLIRSLVLTRAFQLANRPSPAAREADPQNRLLQHYPARRLEAEAIRDSILAASGRLDPSLYGPSIQPYREKANADRRLFPGPLDGNGRRSIYIKNNLMEAPKFLGAFNFPGGKVAPGPPRRDQRARPGAGPAQRPVRRAASGSLGRNGSSPGTDASVAARVERDVPGGAWAGRPSQASAQRFEQAVAQLRRAARRGRPAAS